VPRTIQSENGSGSAEVELELTPDPDGVMRGGFLVRILGVTKAGPSVRAASTGTGANGQKLYTLPTRVAGDILIAFIENDGAGLYAPNTGWTQRGTPVDDGVTVGLSVFTRVSDGTDNVPVTNNSPGAYSYTIVAVKSPTTGYDAVALAASASVPAAAIPAPTVTAGGPACLVNCYVRSANTGTVTPPAGQAATTPVASFGQATMVCGSEAVGPGATGTRTATNSSSTNWCAASVTIR
jgi:hypothetical protein